MAFLAPLAGTAATAATATSVGLGVASTGIAAFGAIQSGQASKAAYEQQARDTEQAAKDQELIRLQNLRRAQSSQRAYWASRGVSATTGSPATIAQQSRLGYQLESSAAQASTGREIQKLQSAGSAAQTAGWIKAGSGIADFGAKV